MAFGVKTGNIFDLLEDNDNENVEPTKTSPKQSPAKEKEAAAKGKCLGNAHDLVFLPGV